MSTATAGTSPPPAQDPEHSRPGVGWRIVSVLGEIFITLGVVLLLFVVYELFWTNVVAEQQAEEQREELISTWNQADQPVAVETPPIPAEAFGLMYIPRLQGDVWGTPLIEGVEDDDLTKGIGHFPDSALPGQVGNSSYAGHRATHGEPLAHVDQLQAGDMVYIETGAGWFSYRLREDQIVQPTDVWVVDPVPGAAPQTVPSESMLTLITCHPRWGSTQRWVWWGDLTQIRTRDDGPPDEVVAILEAS